MFVIAQKRQGSARQFISRAGTSVICTVFDDHQGKSCNVKYSERVIFGLQFPPFANVWHCIGMSASREPETAALILKLAASFVNRTALDFYRSLLITRMAA
jgi:DNA-binding transcriptional regulator LsrR (DeoR family)